MPYRTPSPRCPTRCDVHVAAPMTRCPHTRCFQTRVHAIVVQGDGLDSAGVPTLPVSIELEFEGPGRYCACSFRTGRTPARSFGPQSGVLQRALDVFG